MSRASVKDIGKVYVNWRHWGLPPNNGVQAEIIDFGSGKYNLREFVLVRNAADIKEMAEWLKERENGMLGWFYRMGIEEHWLAYFPFSEAMALEFRFRFG